VSRDVRFEPEASGELDEAAGWYEQRATGLGSKFLSAVDQTLGPLKDLDVLNAVMISPEGYTLLWPNGADFDPATLHDWPEVEAEFVQMAQSWGRRLKTATD